VGDEEKPKPKTERLGFRADQDLTTRVNDLIAAMERSSRMKGFDVNMTVALKMLVRRALPLAELEYEGFIQGMTYLEEGDYLVSELRALVSQAGIHPGVDHDELLEIAEYLRSLAEDKAKHSPDRSEAVEDPIYKTARESQILRVLEARKRRSS
jgi:hypothetical protein